MKLENFSFKAIRTASFVFILIISVAGGAFLYIELDQLLTDISSPIEKERPFLSRMLHIQNLTSSLDLSLHSLISGNIVDNKAPLELIEQIQTKVNSNLQLHRFNVDQKQFEDNFIRNLKKLKVTLVYYKHNHLIDPASSSSEELFDIIEDLLTNINGELSSIIVTIREQINRSNLKALEHLKVARTALLIIFFGVVIIGVLIFFLFNMSLSTHLKKLIKSTTMIGDGDLTWRINSKFNDEFGTLSHALDEMADGIYQQTLKIETLAYNDSLTDLPNRTTFMLKLKEEISRASRNNQIFAVLFIDLDDFKIINDIYGHEIGDLLLKQVAERMVQSTRISDTVARIGGDEFTILLPLKNTQDDAMFVGKRIAGEIEKPLEVSSSIIQSISEPFHIKDNHISISSSIGISIYPDNGDNEAEILRNADTAMYIAKAEGKNNFKFCTVEIAERVQNLLRLENDLKKSITNNELSVSYQPQINIQSGKLSGMEALIRWNHPINGFIPPAQFIPLAEQRGLISQITRWILETVCLRINEWKSMGIPIVPISINLSAKDFQQKDIGEILKELISTQKIDPSMLGIEITETAVMEDKSYAIKLLSEVQSLGVKVSLDDFGTGYSSLNYLQSLPIDIVKIDRSFITHITTDDKSAKITQAIITMSHALGLKVLVEGVESREQYEFIKGFGCDYFQGFLYSKPLPDSDITEYLMSSPCFY